MEDKEDDILKSQPGYPETGFKSNVSQEESERPKAKGFPRIFRVFTREEPYPHLTDSQQSPGNQSTMEQCCPASEGCLGVSVISQTEESWLSEHVQDDNMELTHSASEEIPFEDSLSSELDSISTYLDQELKEISIFTDIQFLQAPLLSKIGPPIILAYKQESRDKATDPRDVVPQVQSAENSSQHVECEFCGQKQKPFPTRDQIKRGRVNELFCCSKYQLLYEFLMKEQDSILGKKGEEKISIDPHPPHGNQEQRDRAKERTAQRLREREMAKYYQITDMNPSDTPGYSKQFKTISYQLSSSAPKEGSWTVTPRAAIQDQHESEDDVNDEDSFMPAGDFFGAHSKGKKNQFTEKYYANGNKFLTVFPDGTAQVLYPSGNLAVLIIENEQREFTCLVQEDQDTSPAIQAVFDSNGKGTCYHPNGVVWLNMNRLGGLHSDENGNKVKQWKWTENPPSTNCTPFKPVFLSLSHNVGVRILEQERIFISFLAMGKQAKFNVGAKIKVKDTSSRPSIKLQLARNDLLLFASRIKIQTTFHKLYASLSFPSSKHLDRAKPPLYLISLSKKLASLCEKIKLEKKELMFIKASIESCLDV
ncbi:glutamate-rich protein 6 isoform X2 [Polyodon spathula]|uniref:glutamate-rich protein 6 isoform X2 n=1 Tax=Polyodon spathula TaxID=7913 RepID=UPI001B7E68F8|nr:glutamate-rich protein 6 isoform X2 [Polyodon spathula]